MSLKDSLPFAEIKLPKKRLIKKSEDHFHIFAEAALVGIYILSKMANLGMLIQL